jgi:peptide/nickel transport system ATP-binding protein
MRRLQAKLGLSYLLISHNLAVVAHMADRVGVMYLGRLVEWGAAQDVLERPQHPYTRMLLDAVPDVGTRRERPQPFKGEVPSSINPPSGCAFHPRCPLAEARCARERPHPVAVGAGWVACHAVEKSVLS